MAKANNPGKAIGTVSALNGKATAVGPRGETRVLKNGDSVFENEKVTAQDGSSVHINLANSGFATIGAGDSITFNANILADAAKVARENAPANEPTATSDAEIEAVQALIAKGADPTEVTEAAAAGPQSGSGAGDEGSNFVIVSQNAARGEVTPGFGTDSFSLAAAGKIETATLYSIDAGDNGGGGSSGGDNGGSGGNGGGSVTPPPPLKDTPYTERMVMYMDSANLSGNPNSMKMVAKANTGQHVDSTDTPTSTHSYGDVSIVGGDIQFELNAAGQAALDALAPGAHLVDYITYKGLDGQEYVIQVVLTKDAPGQFDFDTLKDYDGNVAHNIPGETHYGHAADGKYNVKTSAGDDVFESQSMHDSKIVTGKGSDTVLVNGNLKDSTIALGDTPGAIDTTDHSNNYLGITGSVSGSQIFGTAGNDRIIIGGKDNNGTPIATPATPASGNITAMENSHIHDGNGNNRIDVFARSTTGTAIGMHGSSITTGNNSAIKINTDSTSGAAYGIYADNTGSNTISSKDINIFGRTSGVFATGSGENTITGQNGTVSIMGNSALQANGGKNTVTVDNGSISLQGNLSSGTNAGANAENGGSNIMTGTGSTWIKASGNQYGLYAANGSNTITTENGQIIISGSSSGGMYATTNGINRAEGATISITSNKNAVDSVNGGKNYVDAGTGKVTIQGGTYYGVSSVGDRSLADVRGGEVNIKGNYYALGVDDKGTINVVGDKVNLSATYGMGIKNWTNGTINVEARDELNVRLTGANQSSAAVMTLDGTTTLKSGGNINLIVDKGTYQTAGINTWSSGTTNVEAENNINIKVHAEKGSGVSYGAVGIQVGSTHGGTNNITAKHGDITLDIDSFTSGASGISTSGSGVRSGVTNINAQEGTLTVNVTGTKDAYNAFGISASGYGTNNIDVGKLDMNVKLDSGSNYQGGHGAAAILASYNGQYYGVNNINVTGDMDVRVSSAGNTSGILAQGSGSIASANNIHAGNFTLDVTSTGTLADSRATGVESNRTPSGGSYAGGNNIIDVDNNASITVTGKDLAAGFYSANNGKQELTAGGEVDINVTATDGKAYGIFGGAKITADSVTMTIKGDLSAIVMDGKGTLTGAHVVLNAESDSGTSYGMYNTGTGINTVQSGNGQALDLEINADYAMYATAQKNVITGHSTSSGPGDTIQLNGDIYQSGSGRNEIKTGDGHDTIIINGSISGAGALYIDGGAGADTLVLQAANLTEFMARYGSWLNGLNATILKGVEKIEFTGIDDLNDLRPALDNFFAYANGVQPPIEVGIHTPDALAAFGLDSMAPDADTPEDTAPASDTAQHSDDASAAGLIAPLAFAGEVTQGHHEESALAVTQEEQGTASATGETGHDTPFESTSALPDNPILEKHDDVISAGQDNPLSGTANDQTVQDSTADLAVSDPDVGNEEKGDNTEHAPEPENEGAMILDTSELHITGDYSLSELATPENDASFEVIDMSHNGQADTLVIDSVLTGLFDNSNPLDKLLSEAFDASTDASLKDALMSGDVIRVMGDTGVDNVVFNADWSDTGNAVIYDGVAYNVYHNAADNGQNLLVQQDLNIIGM